MRTRILFLIAIMSLAWTAVSAAPKPAAAAADPLGPPALVGQVSSQEEGPMEGVVVSAKKDGSTITVSVISDNKGHYSFPASRLEPGHYTLKIRAIGYSLDAPATADLAAQKATTADLKLVKAKSSGSADDQRGMARKHAWHGRAEGFPSELRQLPHASENRPVHA